MMSPARATLLSALVLLVAACVPRHRTVAGPRVTLGPSLFDDGPFRLVYGGPRGEDPASGIALAFSRPVHAPGVSDVPAPGSVVSVHDGATVGGAWHWYGESAALFEPSPGIARATTYRVDVHAVRALDGSTLAGTESFTFTTARPRLERASYSYTAKENEHIVALVFDQAVAPSAARDAIRIEGRGPSGVREIPYRVVEAEERKNLTLVVDTSVARSEDVVVVARPTLVGVDGPLRSEKEARFPLEEVGPLRASFSCTGQDGERTTSASPKCALDRGSVELVFSKEVTSTEVLRRLVVRPSAKQDPDARRYMMDQATTFDLGALFALLPDQKYTFTLRNGVRSFDRDRLAEDRTFTFESAGLEPSLGWNDLEGDASLVERARPTIRLVVHSTNVPSYRSVRAPLDRARLVEVLFPANDAKREASWVAALPGSVSETVVSKAKPDERHRTEVELGPSMRAPNVSGAFVVAMTAPGLVPDNVHVLSVTDLGVTTKWSPHGSVVWVTRLSTGEVVPRAKVTLQRVWRPTSPGETPRTEDAFTTTTDDGGVALVPDPIVSTFVRAGAPDPLAPRAAPDAEALLLVDLPATADWTYARLPELDPRLLSAIGYVFVERGLYRPGENLLVKGYFRAPSPRGLANPAGKTATLEVEDSSGRPITARAVTLDAFGAFSSEIPLPRDVRLGRGRIRARVGAEPSPRRFDRHRAWTHDSLQAQDFFTVDTFRTPEIKLVTALDRPFYVRGETATAQLTGTYLLGTPLSDRAVQFRATRRATTYRPPGLDELATDVRGLLELGTATRDRTEKTELASSEPKLDARGRASVPLVLAPPSHPLPETLTVEASVDDVSRTFVVGDDTSVVIHPGDRYVGIRARPSPAVRPGKPVTAEVAVAAIDGRRLGGVRTRVELLRQVKDGKARAVVTTTGRSCEVVTEAGSVATCELPTTAEGTYWLRASAADGAGRPIGAAVSFAVTPLPPPPKRVEPPPPPDPVRPRHVAPPETFDEACAHPAAKNAFDALALEGSEAHNFVVGDPARFCLRAWHGGNALFTLEREGVLQRRAFTLARDVGARLDVPVTEALQPNVLAVLSSVTGRTSPFPSPRGVDVGSPGASTTGRTVRVEPSRRALTVAIDPIPDQRPGTDIELRVHVREAGGQGAPSQVTLWAVDEGIHLLVQKSVPVPQEAFSDTRSSDVVESDTRSNIFRELGESGGHQVKAPSLRQGSTSTSDRNLVGRSVFRPTAFYLPNIVTGPDGNATVRAKLPDNLTTWKVFAVAATAEAAFGSGESSFHTNKPLLVRPALPGFVRVGDRFEAVVVVDSLAKTPVDVTLSMTTTGALAGPPRTTRATIPAEGHVPFSFPVEGRSVGTSSIAFHVASGTSTLADDVTLEREVVPVATLETSAVSGETRAANEAIQLSFGDLGPARRDVGGLDVRISTSPLVGLAESLAALVEYPYGCTEQLTSRLLPLIRLRGMAHDLGVTLPANVDAAVRASLTSLLGHQRADGGFGFWASSQASEPWLTILAVHTLHEAREHGYVVPPSAMERATASLLTPGPKPLDAAERAMLEDLLASVGKPRSAELRTLLDDPALPLFGKALVVHALASIDRPLALRALAEIAAKAQTSASLVTFHDEHDLASRTYLSSDARTTAMVLRAFAAVEPRDPVVPKLVRGLLSMRHDGRWATTQATAWALGALDDVRSLQKPLPGRSTATLSLGDTVFARGAFSGLPGGETATGALSMSRLLASPGAPAFEASRGGIHYVATLHFARLEPPGAPLDRGMSVARDMHALVAGTPTRVGTYVVVDVVVANAAPQDLVVLDDPIPAGFETVNDEFANADRAHGLVDDPSQRIVTRRELREERVVTFFDALPAGAHVTRYVLRAIAPGHFVVPPARAGCMYTPDVFGRSATTAVEVGR